MHTFMAALLTGKADKKAREDSYKKLISLAFRCVWLNKDFQLGITGATPVEECFSFIRRINCC